ncbi:MAG: DNA methyltransferase [Candidatus Cloacimonetes bacterium]|nr:DNA methyltransferase [Candidatus Cloacimonadota bacterium]
MDCIKISNVIIPERKRPLKPEAVKALADSIEEIGLINPITLKPDGTINTGRHRLEACKLLGWDEIPFRYADTNDGRLLELAEIDENLIRNELTVLERADHLARRKEIYEELHPETKVGQYGGGRGGVGTKCKTETEIISFSDDTAAKTGVTPRTIRQEVQISKKIAPEVKEAIRNTPLANSKTDLLEIARSPVEKQKSFVHEVVARGETDILKAAREIKKQRKEERQAEKEKKRAEMAEASKDLPLPVLVDLRQGDFRDVLDDLPDNSIDLIFTDPPYDAGSIPLYEELAIVSARVLKPGGSLLAYCGQYALPEILTSMSRHLRYWWLVGIKHQNNYSSLTGKKLYVCWKPLVWFVKDTNGSDEYVMDMFDSKTPDKSLHDWGQSGEEAAYFIRKLCPPGGTVLDPFAGSGTTLYVAASLGIKSLGVEIEEKSANLIRGRLNGISI